MGPSPFSNFRLCFLLIHLNKELKKHAGYFAHCTVSRMFSCKWSSIEFDISCIKESNLHRLHRKVKYEIQEYRLYIFGMSKCHFTLYADPYIHLGLFYSHIINFPHLYCDLFCTNKEDEGISKHIFSISEHAESHTLDQEWGTFIHWKAALQKATWAES